MQISKKVNQDHLNCEDLANEILEQTSKAGSIKTFKLNEASEVSINSDLSEDSEEDYFETLDLVE